MIKVGSDFSGVGAFNQALMRLGIDYEEVFACDMDKYARQTFIHNYGEPSYYPKNVYDREIPTEPLDIYMTSPPCQAFSLAGKRKGEEDKRGILFYNSHEFIQKNKPRFFIFENVKGLLSDAGGKTFQVWCDMLGGKSVNGNPVLFPNSNAVPYHIYWKVLNAKEYGVPQNRERVFIVGIRDDQDNYFRWPKPMPLEKRLKDVLEDNVDDRFYLSKKMIKYLHHRNENTTFGKGKLNYKNGDNIANCITKSSSSLDISDNIIKVGNTNPSGHGINGNVFDEEGVSPCLTTNKGEGIKIKSATKKGYEVATEGDSINLSHPNSGTRRGRVGKEIAQTLETSCSQGVLIGAIRGRNPDNPKSREAGLPTQQMLEINENGTSNALTTVQKDNVVVYNDKRLNQTIQKNKHELVGGEIKMLDTYNQSVHNLSPCIKARHHQNNDRRLFDGHIIRRLTPRECFRLMDFPDTFTWPVSDTQAYKQAGNSIVVNVLAKIIEKLKL